ncbi:thioredoxin [Candidatus Woesearchaeota archaeon]|nr:thioredoxin [Candidatus Woesearchaeota archaeon]
MTVIYVKDAFFERDVLQSKLPVVVDFYADWCGPCTMMAPSFEEVSKDFAGKVTFAKVNVDENPLHAGGLSIMSIPCLILFRNGKEVSRQVGAMNKATLKGWVTEHI